MISLTNPGRDQDGHDGPVSPGEEHLWVIGGCQQAFEFLCLQVHGQGFRLLGGLDVSCSSPITLHLAKREHADPMFLG